MRTYWSCLSAFLFFMLGAIPVQAQASRTWVSGVGDDANPCSRTAPCKTFAGAISKTAAGGEIDALDPAGFGALTITKAITIDGGGGQVASVLVAGTNGINVSAGANDVVILKNLRFNGIGSGLTGINYLSGAALVIENCAIYDFITAGIGASTSATSKLIVTNTTITNSVIGINAVPTGALSGQVDHSNIQVMTTAGIKATGPANITISNSSVANAATAVLAGAGSIMGVDSSQINHNTTAFSTTGGFMRVSRNIVFDNVSDFSIAGGGTIASAGNNIVAGNGATVPNGTVTQR
ncbi:MULTISPECIES: hypothetical protein [Bradyrhizobium]|uniref:hypothetical protein n=1 Tax=Bradyrhizobium TaxID=374 RepID=UPI001EDA0FF9|nr:hypothetical protein [Bradyrhizobium zhengyangense]MCG2643611.1 hypothetical protein [Bradyrhizobium zhengyangense]